MIHIATTHWKSKLWIDIQLNYIQKHTPNPYKIYCLATDINIHDCTDKFHFIQKTELEKHGEKLDFLAKKILEEGNNDDLIVFIDGDAFPISNYLPFIKEKIEKHKIIAIRRDENRDLFPHSSFFATTIGFWKKLEGTWKNGKMKNIDGIMINEVGVKLFKKIKKLNINWYPLLRTNKINYHPVFFGIYGDMIYHHGAGFRDPLCRYDTRGYYYRVLTFIINLFYYILIKIQKHFDTKFINKNQILSEHVIRMIQNDEEFDRYFIN